MGNFIFVKKDLFTMPQGYCLAHCISADCALGAGIAKEFDNRFNMKEKLNNYMSYLEEPYVVGDVIKIDNVYNLITKRCAFEKPTYEDFQKTIQNFVEILENDCVKKIAIPKIGAGLDKLNWKIVLAILRDAFRESNIEVTICSLEDEEKNHKSDKNMTCGYNEQEEFEKVAFNTGYFDDTICPPEKPQRLDVRYVDYRY